VSASPVTAMANSKNRGHQVKAKPLYGQQHGRSHPPPQRHGHANDEEYRRPIQRVKERKASTGFDREWHHWQAENHSWYAAGGT
jgi:hypothetical protein